MVGCLHLQAASCLGWTYRHPNRRHDSDTAVLNGRARIPHDLTLSVNAVFAVDPPDPPFQTAEKLATTSISTAEARGNADTCTVERAG